MSSYTVKAPEAVTGSGWGLSFMEGVAHTEDEYLARKLARKGYTVTEDGAAHGLACPVCQKPYKSEKGLADHLAREHPGYKPAGE